MNKFIVDNYRANTALYHSLYKVSKVGEPLSYVKGIYHDPELNNICTNTINALNSSTALLYETNADNVFKGQHMGYSEYLIYSLAQNKLMTTFNMDWEWQNIRQHPYYKMIRQLPKKRVDSKLKKKNTDKINKIFEHPLAGTDFLMAERHKYLDEIRIRHPAYMYHMITARNAKWAENTKDLMSKENCFIICGMRHVHDLLSRYVEQGYTITPIDQGSLLKLNV